MCNLGSRLQSAKVSSGPSRKFLEDSGRSSEASASISAGRGVLRKSSRRLRDLSKAFSKAAGEMKNTYTKVKYSVMADRTSIKCAKYWNKIIPNQIFRTQTVCHPINKSEVKCDRKKEIRLVPIPFWGEKIHIHHLLVFLNPNQMNAFVCYVCWTNRHWCLSAGF